MKKIPLISAFLAVIALFSCSSDKVESSENFIESFSLPKDINAQWDIADEDSLIHVVTAVEVKALSAVEPTVEVSEGASLTKEGENWTAEDFKYIVTAENGEVRKYSISLDTVSKINSFEDWNSKNGYYRLSDLNWSSGNSGISMALAILGRGSENPENYPSKKTEDGYSGNAVLLETIAGGTVFKRNIPLFSGNFFLGNFNANKAISDELAATELGRIYFSKPKSVKGYYKYKEGTEKVGDIENDSCDIYAAFYKAEDEAEKEVILTAKDTLDKNPYVLSYSRLQDCSETDGEDFKEFSLDLSDYSEEPDFENNKYKLLITFAASKGGAKFIGKIGSKLIVDEVTIEDY